MAEIRTIKAESRDRAGKGSARAARRAGRVPAVIYGGKEAPQMITIGENELTGHYRRGGFESSLFNIDIDGAKHQVLPRDLHLHPVTDRVIHADFLRVAAGAKVTIMVTVHFNNADICPGLKRGGVLNVVRHEVELRCPATAIPERLEADLSTLDIGDGIHISDIALPEGATPTITDRDFTIATIAAPTVAVEPAEGAEEESEAEQAKEDEDEDE